jgi:ribosomal protein L32
MTKRERWEAAEARRKEKRAHTWIRLKFFPWRVCCPGCGLVALRNEVSVRAAKRRCPSWD